MSLLLSLLESEYTKTGELSMDALTFFAEQLHLPLAQVVGAASFYAGFNGGKLGEVCPCKLAETLLPIENRRVLSQKNDYAALKAAIKKPEGILDAVIASGLRGRGGAGFPVGLKWKTTRDCADAVKYVVVNADEGEPDTAKDGVILNTVPHAVLEGMAICGICVGAKEGYIYIRAEYPETRKIVEAEIARAEKEGILGKNILDSGFDFTVSVVSGAGSYVCGEETALLSSIEGQRGEPRLKPPFPGVAGLYGKPTVVNNVESMANISLVVNLGAKGYRAVGTEKNPGTKVITICGVEREGVYEVPLGTPIRTILGSVGCDFSDMKALQIGGGASGALIGVDQLDTALDIEGLAAAGGSLGTGSIRVIHKSESMVALCAKIAAFFAEESCGKCTPCRFATKKMADMLSSGTFTVETLKEQAAYLTDNARCAFGQAASTVLLSAIRLCPEEFEGVAK